MGKMGRACAGKAVAMESRLSMTVARLFLVQIIVFISCAYAEKNNPQMDLIVSALQKVDDPKIQVSFLKGMLSGLTGQRNVAAPKGWVTLKEKLEKEDDAEVKKLVAQLSQIFGDESASQAALATLRDNTARVEARRSALKSLLAQRHSEVPIVLESLLSQSFQIDVIRAYAAYDYSKAPDVLLKKYSKLDSQARRAVIETLSSRKSYGQALLKGIEQGKVKKDEVPAYVARSLKVLLGEDFEKVYGKVKDVSADKGKLMAQYKSRILSPEMNNADASRGRAVYQRTCAACHIMYGEGGKIGPELTGSNRADTDYILLNIIDPNFDVPEGYRMVTITSRDGRVYAGNVTEEDNAKVVLTMVGQTSVISKADIKTRLVSKISLMPEGLLLTLKDKEILDLIKYLRTEKQVELPK
jgi:putative heme-binding domain-containing protein